MQLKSLRFPLVLLGASLGMAGCSSTPDTSEVIELVRKERFEQAVHLAAERVEQKPDDLEARRLHRDATVALILDQGRDSIFEKHFEDGLKSFNEALTLAPENEAVHLWIQKAREELRRQWLDAGAVYIQRGELQEALEAYELALYYAPEDPEALLGSGRVLLLINYRQGMGEEYYNEGVRAVYEHVFRVARGEFQKSEKYQPDHQRTADRMEFVESALADERSFVASVFEDDGRFGAAMNEYRLVLLLEPGDEEARAGFERMQREVQAKRMLSEADKHIRQGRFEEALLTLDEGAQLTQLQSDSFTLLVNEIEVAHWESLYQEGVSLQQDFDYEQAIETFAGLLDAAEFYLDAANRKATLEEYVGRAAGLYAELIASDDSQEQLQLLREIEVFWPEYRDVPERLRALAKAD